MEKFPKIKYPNSPETDGLTNGEVVVTEKLDGANFRFTWGEDGELYVGTRNHTYRWDDENLPTAFEHAVEYVRNHERDLYAFPDITFYGEAMHLHSLDYDDIDWHNPASGSPHVPHDSDKPNVVLFDARQDGEWMDWDDFTEVVAPTDFEVTRIIERGDADGLSFEIPDESMFGGNPEGIVARRTDGSVRAKKVRDDFHEQNGGGSTTYVTADSAAGNAADFVNQYVTRNRVEKTAHKLVDEGHYERLCMPMMEDLPRAVLEDVGAELFWPELLSDDGFEAEWDEDFKGEVRSKTSRRCSRVLRSMCQQI